MLCGVQWMASQTSKSSAAKAAGGGHPLIDPHYEDCKVEDWTNINGHFQRIPLNTSLKFGHIATTGTPIYVLIDDGRMEQPWISRPDRVKAQKIRRFAGQPLAYRGEVIGVLAVLSRTELSEGKIGWLRAYADHAAVAIVTERMTDQIKALNASAGAMAERWRSVFEKSAIGAALTDSNGRFLDANSAYI